MVDKLVIGKIVKPQGIRGELKVLPLTSAPDRFDSLKEVYVGDATEPTRVMGVRISCGELFMYLERVADRNEAEKYRNLELKVNREDAVKPEGSYFIVDLIGCLVVFEDGEQIGVLYDVLQNGPTDVYAVRLPSGKSVLFPALLKVLKDVDVEKELITVVRERFNEVACYED